MFKKGFIFTLSLLLIMVSFIGCGSKNSVESQNPGENTPEKNEPVVLNWNIGAEPKTIDPGLNSAVDGGHVVNNTFEGLMREIDGKLQPAAAERYEVSEDGLVYTFYLKDSKWSDGKPVTAHDFEYSWKRVLDPVTASEYASQLFYIKGGQEYYDKVGSREEIGVKAIDDKTLEVTLKAPTAYFLELTAFYTYMPVRQDMVEKDPEGWAKNPATAMANGPFKLVEYVMGDKLVLEKNEHYWNAKNVKLDRIIGTMIVEESTELTAYEAGELDIIDTMPNQEIPRLQAEDPTFKILPDLSTYYYIFNATKKPVDDKRVRRALALAIDRTSIVEKVTKAGQAPASGIVPKGLKDSQGNEFRKTAGNYGIDLQAANVEEAKKLLAEAGYPDGKGFPEIEILYNTSEGHKQIAEAIQEMWKQNLGINVKLQNQEWAVFQDTRHQGNFYIARAGWGADYADPMTFLDLWTSYSGNNDTQWRNKEYDKKIEAAKVASGQERDKLMYEVEKWVMDEMIVMPIYYYTDPVMVKAHVVDWEKTILGHWFFGKTDIKQ